MKLNKIYEGDCLEGMKNLPDNSVDCCVTSPPYFGLRDYGMLGQLGLEGTPDEYVEKMVHVFNEVRRILKPTGTLWLNIGDSYAATSKKRTEEQVIRKSKLRGSKSTQIACKNQPNKITSGLKAKDLIGIPWMLAFALRNDGWYLRQDIIWSKPNPMPESVHDRCTKSHEYIFLLTKSPRYYYDALSIATPYADKTYTTFGCKSTGNGDGSGLIKSENWARDIKKKQPKKWKMPDGWDTGPGAHGSYHRNGREKGKTIKGYDHRGLGDKKIKGHSGNYDSDGNLIGNGMANKRSVWVVPTEKFKEAHFATFPEKLIVDCIKAGCPEGGIVLDPFMGAGTTAVVTHKLNRGFIGFELNPEYIEIANRRLKAELGMFI